MIQLLTLPQRLLNSHLLALGNLWQFLVNVSDHSRPKRRYVDGREQKVATWVKHNQSFGTPYWYKSVYQFQWIACTKLAIHNFAFRVCVLRRCRQWQTGIDVKYYFSDVAWKDLLIEGCNEKLSHQYSCA